MGKPTREGLRGTLEQARGERREFRGLTGKGREEAMKALGALAGEV